MENKLKNFGIIVPTDYVGKTLTEANEIAKDAGFITRIVERDGNSFILTMDYRTDRLNFRVSNDIIVDIYGG
jgi:hypothetical protein